MDTVDSPAGIITRRRERRSRPSRPAWTRAKTLKLGKSVRMDWRDSAHGMSSRSMDAMLVYIESIIHPDLSLDPSPERLRRQTLSTQTQSACPPPRDDLGGLGDIEGVDCSEWLGRLIGKSTGGVSRQAHCDWVVKRICQYKVANTSHVIPDDLSGRGADTLMRRPPLAHFIGTCNPEVAHKARQKEVSLSSLDMTRMPSMFLPIAIAYHIVLAPIAISQFTMETQGDAQVYCSTP